MELGEITHHNIKQLKRLNTVVFPVSYNEKFYKDVLEAGELAKLGMHIFLLLFIAILLYFIICTYLAYYNDIVVGAVCCRIDQEVGRRLYIMTLGCLSQYRRLGIGSMMVEHVLNYVENDGGFDSVYLLVFFKVLQSYLILLNYNIFVVFNYIFIYNSYVIYKYLYFRHVQLNNDSAIKFYKKFGFEIVETKEHYYKRIEPADAYVLEKRLRSKTLNGKNEVLSNSNKKD